MIDSYDIAKKFNVPVVISGGISSMNDINKIISKDKKIEGIIVGKAIYDGDIKLDEQGNYDCCQKNYSLFRC